MRFIWATILFLGVASIPQAISSDSNTLNSETAVTKESTQLTDYTKNVLSQILSANYVGSCGGWYKDENGEVIDCHCSARPMCDADGNCWCSWDDEKYCNAAQCKA